MTRLDPIDEPTRVDVAAALDAARSFAKTDRLVKIYAGKGLKLAFPDITWGNIESYVGFDGDLSSAVRNTEETPTWSPTGLDMVLTALARAGERG